MISACCAFWLSGSRLPLYFFWIFCISGWMSCIRREEWICRTKSGMSRIRTTTVRPTIDSAHAQPARPR